MRLKEKVALITGAGSGIGRATAKRFAREGAQVVGADKNAEQLESLATEETNIDTMTLDVTNRADTESAVDEIVSRYGKLDVLVNSAGISPRGLNANADFEARWDSVIEVNLKGSMLMSHAAVEAMRRNESGAIVNLGSIMSVVGYPTTLPFSDGFNPYPSSKGAIAQLTKDMGVRLAKEGIRVNAVCPGFVYTALTKGVTENPDIHKTMKDLHPIGRLGTVEEIANVITFLASDEASFVVGACWLVDGGWAAQ